MDIEHAESKAKTLVYDVGARMKSGEVS